MMSAIFGACMGAVMYRLIIYEEYFCFGLAIVAFAIYLFSIVR